MKKFYYTREITNKKYNNIKLNIYRLFKNELKFIGSVCYTLGGCSQGSESEVLHYVCKMGLVPKKALEMSQDDWSDAGYYCPAVENKYCSIKIIF